MIQPVPPELHMAVFGAMCMCIGFGGGMVFAATGRCLLCAAFRVGRWMRG